MVGVVGRLETDGGRGFSSSAQIVDDEVMEQPERQADGIVEGHLEENFRRRRSDNCARIAMNERANFKRHDPACLNVRRHRARQRVRREKPAADDRYESAKVTL